MASGGASVMGGVRAALAFWRTHTRAAVGALAVFTLVVWATQSIQAMGLPWWVEAVGSIIELFATALAYGALFRLAFAPDHSGDKALQPRPGGLTWGGVETRLLGALLLVLFFYTLIALAVVFVVFLMVVVFAAAEGLRTPTAAGFFTSPAGVSVIIFLAAAAIATLWTGIRLSLTLPATVDRGRVQMFSVWSLTKGYVWPIAGGAVICLLPGIAVAFLAGLIRNEASGAVVVLGSALAIALAIGFVQTPLIAGLYAYYYRLLSDQGGVAAPDLL